MTAQLYFPNQFLDELYTKVDLYRRHQQMKAPGTERRLRNEEDGPFLADQSTPMPIELGSNVVTAEAVIGVATLGSVGVSPLFRCTARLGTG